MNTNILARSRGFTLIELIIAIVIFSIASLALIAPALISARGVGAGGAASGMQLAAKGQEYAEIISSDLTGLSQSDWAPLLSGLVSSSPITTSPGATLNGKTFRVTESFSCVEKDLKTIDASCAKGFARIVVTVTIIETGKTFALPFIKTRTGI
ncbi:hypothetical protein MNBD_NITROSPINAE02-86 [hydrothermal vent metagenome]|uniref:Prepilin-type N-terminal cleavage/methylation domain-containing protein n=1 Tax=hydrothermal vent metagenome TaxID=652676 RepID=A0A3B1CBR0_9ZZZZ